LPDSHGRKRFFKQAFSVGRASAAHHQGTLKPKRKSHHAGLFLVVRYQGKPHLLVPF
jgi:hypothetical protein